MQHDAPDAGTAGASHRHDPTARTDRATRSQRSGPAPDRHLVRRPLGALAGVVTRFPVAIVVIVLAVTGALLAVSGQAQEASQNEGMMPDLPAVTAGQTIAERFGSADEVVLQVLIRGEGTELVGRDGYLAADELEAAIRANVPSDRLADVDGRPAVITWMFPAQLALAGANTETLDDDTVVTSYLAEMPELPAEQAGMAQALLPQDADPVAADRALAFVFLSTEGLADDPAVRFDELTAIQEPLASAVAGASLPEGISAEAFSDVLLYVDDGTFDAEIARLFGGAFLVIVLILAFVYWVRPQAGLSRTRSGRRSVADLLLSMGAIVMAIMWMTGAGVLLGPGYLDLIGGMTEFSQVIPILLIGLGVDYAIHLTSRTREELGAGAGVSDATKRAIGSVGGALVLATVTTALGFLTNVFNPIPAIRDFGVLSAVGIVAAFVLTLTFVPAMRLLFDRRAERAGRLPVDALGRSSERLLPGLMARTAVLAEKAPVPTLLVTLVLAGLGAVGMSQLETRFDATDFLPEDSPALATLEELGEHFNGGYGETTEVLITGDVATPQLHNALVDAHGELVDVDDVVVHGEVAAANSMVSVLAQLVAPGPDGVPAAPDVAEVASAVGLGDDLRVPADADVRSLYLAIQAAVPDVADQLIATDGAGRFDATVVRMQTTANDVRASQLRDAVDAAFAGVAAAGDVEVVTTSEPIMWQTVITALQDSQVSSLAITLLVAMLLLVAVFAYEQRRPALGVITIVPVALVVLWTFGMMAVTDIPFGPITATIAALAIGIGLPYAIHVTHRFTEDRARYEDVGAAIRSTVRHTGGAMAGSAFTTMAGFGILVTSSLVPFRQLGAVTVYAVGFSLLAATLVLPSLLVLWDRWYRRDDSAGGGPSAAAVEEPVTELAGV